MMITMWSGWLAPKCWHLPLQTYMEIWKPSDVIMRQAVTHCYHLSSPDLVSRHFGTKPFVMPAHIPHTLTGNRHVSRYSDICIRLCNRFTLYFAYSEWHKLQWFIHVSLGINRVWLDTSVVPNIHNIVKQKLASGWLTHILFLKQMVSWFCSKCINKYISRYIQMNIFKDLWLYQAIIFL